MIFQFRVEEKAGNREIGYDFNGAVLCGYTGRDQAAVRKHIDELAKEGVEPPPSVPILFPKPPWGLTQKTHIHNGIQRFMIVHRNIFRYTGAVFRYHLSTCLILYIKLR